MKTLVNLESSPLLQRQTPRTLLDYCRKHRNPTLHNKSGRSYPQVLIIQPRSASRKLQQPETIKGFNRAWGPAKDQLHLRLQQKNNELERSSKIINGGGNDDVVGDEDEEIAKVVWERMISRILVYVGAPLGTGIAMMQIFSVVKEQNLWDFPIWLPFLTTFITFGASTIGIVYGTLSTSWDPKRKGSALGFEEFQKNWVDMWKEDGDDD